MAQIDIITCAGNAYITFWRERAYLLRLALIPVLIKLACYTFALSAGLEDDVLRLTLCLIPAYFAEGWMLSHLVRLIGLSQRWPFKPSGDNEADRERLMDRARGITTGTVTYVLINVLAGGFMAALLHFGPHGTDPETADPKAVMIALFGLAFSVWSFRLIWLYIPAALNISPMAALSQMSGAGTTLRLMGVWILCYGAPVAAMFFLSTLIVSPFVGGEVPQAAWFGTIIVRVALDTVKAILCTAGIAAALQGLYKPGT